MPLASQARDPFVTIGEIGIVPVIAINNARHALPLADALLAGGLRVAEITFRTNAAAAAMCSMRQHRPELLVGAGTVLDLESLSTAIDSGASFGLAPGFDRNIVAAAAERDFAFAPGVMTPSELGAALHAGSFVCKYFPAGVAGGPAALRAIAAPYLHLAPLFLPTGGVTSENLASWLDVDGVLAVGGTWIATTDDIDNERWDRIEENAREAIRRVRDARSVRGRSE